MGGLKTAKQLTVVGPSAPQVSLSICPSPRVQVPTTKGDYVISASVGISGIARHRCLSTPVLLVEELLEKLSCWTIISSQDCPPLLLQDPPPSKLFCFRSHTHYQVLHILKLSTAPAVPQLIILASIVQVTWSRSVHERVPTHAVQCNASPRSLHQLSVAPGLQVAASDGSVQFLESTASVKQWAPAPRLSCT